MSMFDTLKEEAQKLAALVELPESSTWHEYAMEHCKNLAKLLPTSTLRAILKERLEFEVELRYEREENDGIVIFRLFNQWCRDLDSEKRRKVRDEIEKGLGKRVLLNLNGVTLIDSWGAEAVCDFMEKVVRDGGRVAWVCNPERRAVILGIEEALRMRQLENVPRMN